MRKRTTATLRKARKYAAGGALEKADMGDFTQNDPLSMIKRAVLNQYLGSGAGPGANVTEATRTPGPVVSNAAAKGDLGEPANVTRPDIFAGIPREPDTISEEESYRRMGPVDRYASSYRAPDPNADPAMDVAYNTPLVGNALSARDAVISAANAGKDVHAGRYKSAGLNALLTALASAGAFSPVPFGRTAGRAASGASSRPNVFVSAVDHPQAANAQALNDHPGSKFFRVAGGKKEAIHRETGLAFGADGVPVREIPDAGIRRVPRKWEGGDEAPLKDVVTHPDLFAQRPDLGEIPVRFEQIGYGKQPIARIGKDDEFHLSTDWRHKWLRNNIAKLLQYTVSKEGNMAAAVRHDVTGTMKHVDNTMLALDEGLKNGTLPADAALSYMNRLQAEKDAIEKFMKVNADMQPKAMRRQLATDLSERSAGNILAQIAKKRVGEPGGFPFKDAPDFRTQLVLPHSLDADSLSQFVSNWHRNGAGKYASGGKVKGAISKARAKLATGGLVGHTGGRSDELPVKAAEGSYVIPADVVSALGEGNTMAGNKILFGRFPGALGGGVKKPHLARGGAVDIVVSDGEFIIPPDEVAKLGKGDLGYGHEILDSFVTNTRKQHIQTLAALPGPKT